MGRPLRGVRRETLTDCACAREYCEGPRAVRSAMRIAAAACHGGSVNEQLCCVRGRLLFGVPL